MKGRWIMLWMVGVAAMPLIYAGAYLANIEEEHWAVKWSPDGESFFNIPPSYRVGGRLAEKVFQPAHLIDRQLRRDRWQLRRD